MKTSGRIGASSAAVSILALAAGMICTPGVASAQGFFQSLWGPPPVVVAREKVVRPPPPRRSASRQPAAVTTRASLLPAKSSGRVLIIVSTDQQKLTVYDDGVPVATSTVSTGTPSNPTPHGVFSIIAKERMHLSNLYDSAPMPYMQRLTWSGVALHEGHVTGRVASHGCIRLPAAFAAELFRYTREGARVIIAREEVVPAPSGTIALFAAASTDRKEAPVVPVAGVAASSAPFDLEIEARPRSTGEPTAERPDFAANAPVHILVNRKAGKLYVRRASRPLFQVPISVDDPLRPIGTHVFMAAKEPSRSWLAMSLNTPIREAQMSAGRPMRDAPATTLAASNGTDALARLHLPPGTAAHLGSLIAPGSTLIVSDDGARNREGQDYTNFIALTD